MFLLVTKLFPTGRFPCVFHKRCQFVTIFLLSNLKMKCFNKTETASSILMKFALLGVQLKKYKGFM